MKIFYSKLEFKGLDLHKTPNNHHKKKFYIQILL